jgi:quinol monooxygenase YgiN/quercetin dioxygenase-like cupin family protein
MEGTMSTKSTLVLGLAALAQFPSPAPSQDPLPLYPENYKVILENDRVRVLDFQLKKGAKEMAHSHPAHVVHVITGFRVRFTFPDGTTRIRETNSGDVLFSEAVTHASENIGDTDAHGLLVELKAPPAGPAGGRPLGAAGASEPMAGSMPAEHLTAVTFIKGIEGKEEELKQELLALEAPTRAEPGCIAYDLYQSPDKKQFMRFEVWRDAAALEAHKQTPHLKASFERRKAQGWTTEITLWNRVRRWMQ